MIIAKTDYVNVNQLLTLSIVAFETQTTKHEVK